MNHPPGVTPRMKRWSIIGLAVACAQAAPDGEAIYHDQCASCHGARGEGVPDKVDEPLYGNKSVEALTRYIDKWMPEDEEEKCVGADAAAVAAWIHGEIGRASCRERV